jgi:GH24 family phage-related lysozyme (muramidase)
MKPRVVLSALTLLGLTALCGSIPAAPPSKSRPSSSTSRPAAPSYRPSTPSYRPPSYRPATPSYRPPSYRPSTPSYRPPSYRPSTPSYRPSTASQRPATPSYQPPSYRPSTPSCRPSTASQRPATPSYARPNTPRSSPLPSSAHPSVARPSVAHAVRPATGGTAAPGKSQATARAIGPIAGRPTPSSPKSQGDRAALHVRSRSLPATGAKSAARGVASGTARVYQPSPQVAFARPTVRAAKAAPRAAKAAPTAAQQANLLGRQVNLLGQMRDQYAQQGAVPPDFNKMYDEILQRSFVDPGSTAADGSFDVVFYNKWGSITHHLFSTRAEADQFANEYRHGVYSTADGTLTKIEINGVDRQSRESGTARLAFDETAKKGDAVRAEVKKAVANDPLRSRLVAQEGVRPLPYQDSAKEAYLTTAVGFKLQGQTPAERAAIAANLQSVGLDYAKVVAGVQIPTADQMVRLLDLGVTAAQQRAASTTVWKGDNLNLPLVPNYADLSPERKDVVTNMLFNMGPGKFADFRGMRRALDQEDYQRAAVEMIDSTWYDQVGKRSRVLVEDMGLDRQAQQQIHSIIQDRKTKKITPQAANQSINDVLNKLNAPVTPAGPPQTSPAPQPGTSSPMTFREGAGGPVGANRGRLTLAVPAALWCPRDISLAS